MLLGLFFGLHSFECFLSNLFLPNSGHAIMGNCISIMPILIVPYIVSAWVQIEFLEFLKRVHFDEFEGRRVAFLTAIPLIAGHFLALLRNIRHMLIGLMVSCIRRLIQS